MTAQCSKCGNPTNDKTGVSEIILASEIKVLVERYGEQPIKEALFAALEKDMNPACPEE